MTTRRIILPSTLLVIVILASVMVTITLWDRQSGPKERVDQRYQRFTQLIADGNGAEAVELGDSLFQALLQERPDDFALALLSRRLEVAGRIREFVTNRVQLSQTVLADGIVGTDDVGLPVPVIQNKAAEEKLLPSARERYWTSLGSFTSEWTLECPTKQETAFCRQYYESTMQDLILEIGHHVVVTDPNSSEYACHAMVMPLLYLHGRDGDWDQMESFLSLFGAEMLEVLSMFALLQAERPGAAMAVARYQAETINEVFSATSWALGAADACIASHRPDLADRMLSAIAACLKDQDGSAELRLRIADAYARCGEHAEAAHVCEGILDDLPGTSLYGRIMATRLGYLAKEDDVEQVVAVTASALDDPRCRSHLGQILYLRWWALHKMNEPDKANGIARQLLDEFPKNPCVAPVLLARATDALARQEYNRCRELLTRLTIDFAGTEFAKRGQDILARLHNSAVNE